MTSISANVINLQPAGSRATASANRILLECRDMATRQLRSALRTMLQQIEDTLDADIDACMDAEKRRQLSSLKSAVHEKKGRAEGQLAAHWINGFDKSLRSTHSASNGAMALSLDDLQLVDFGDQEEDLALKAIASHLQGKFENDLYALGRRMNYLIGRESETTSDNPLSPTILSDALKAALRDCGFETVLRLELLRRLDPLVDAHVGPIYQALNSHLLQLNVLPNLKRDYGKAAGGHSKPTTETPSNAPKDIYAILKSLVSGTPGPDQGAAIAEIKGGHIVLPHSVPPPQLWASLETLQHASPAIPNQPGISGEHSNVLHSFRASEVGQGLQQLDAITVDIVAMLFDMIFDDREISDPIKALVGKLQIPVLKVAMLDRSFFSSKAHPTRRLLDLISNAALRWNDQIGHDDPVYRKISDVIEQIHSNFKQDTALFAALCDDLELFLKSQEEAGEKATSRATLLVVQRELEELADIEISVELQSLIASTTPAVVVDLLEREWRAVLKHIHLHEGPSSEPWKLAIETAGNLVASAHPSENHTRQSLARLLPTLLRQLNEGFDRIHLENARRHQVMDALFTVHSALLRGAEPPAPAPLAPLSDSEPVEPSLASNSLADGEVTVESISVSAPLMIGGTEPKIESLQRGDWVEYVQADGTPIRYRLSWISPQRGIFLFTNPHSPNALAISPEAMGLQLRRGEVRILSTEPIFDRALTRTIDTLQAA